MKIQGGESGSVSVTIPDNEASPLGSQVWQAEGYDWNGQGTFLYSTNRAYWELMYVRKTKVFTGIGVFVTSAAGAGSVMRLGLYNSKAHSDGYLIPDTLIVDAGTVAVDSSGFKSITINESLVAGYYFACHWQDGAPTVAVQGGNQVSGTVLGGGRVVLTGEEQDIHIVNSVNYASALPVLAPTPTALESQMRRGILLGITP